MKSFKYFNAGLFFAVLSFSAVGCFSVFSWWAKAELENEENEDLPGRIAGRYAQEYDMTHDPNTNTIPRERLMKARQIADQKRAEMAQKEDALPVYWNERGPNNVGGRTRGLMFDQNDATQRTVWAAGVAGGLWRTTNIDAGVPAWTLMNDFFPTLAISTIAQDPSNTNRLYFGTGERGFNNADAVRGMGIWRSTDGGANWAQLPNTAGSNFQNVNKVVVAPNGWVYAATTAGLFRSTDNGDNWTKILGSGVNAVSNAVQDFEIAANGELFAGINGDGVYRFRNNAWTKLTNNLPTSQFGRVEVGCAPNAGGVVYCAFEDTSTPNTAPCKGFFSTTDGGDNWTARATPAIGVFCWYALIIAVDPNDANRVWIGNQSLQVSADNGDNWTGIGGVHADHHALVYRPGNSAEMIYGNDGGVYWSTNADAAIPTLSERNNSYNVTQFYANALHPNSGSNYFLGGTQDNGTQRFSMAGLGSTDQPTGADGAFCFIDQDNPAVQITGSQNAFFNLSTDGGGSFNTLFGGNNSALFITPADYDDAGNVFYFSNNGGDFGRITDVGGANTQTVQALAALGVGRVSAFAVSPNTANRVFIASENGIILRVENADNAGTISATDITEAAMPNTYVSCIVTENGNDNHLLAVFSNFGVNSIWESNNAGDDWQSIEGDLPDMPIRWAMFHPFNPDQVMVATELGIWSTDDVDAASTEWWPTNNFGLANVRVDMLAYRPSDHIVAAATHGRGMYTTDYFTLLDNCPANMFVGGVIPSGLYMAEDYIESDGTINPGSKVIMQAGNYIDLTDGFLASEGSDFWGLILPCGSVFPKQGSIKDEQVAARSGNQMPGSLLRCSPNPTSFTMAVNCTFESAGQVSLYVRSIEGKMVQTLVSNRAVAAGEYRYQVDASTLTPGIYLLILQTESGAKTERFIVSR